MSNEELARQYARKECGLWNEHPWFNRAYAEPYLSQWFDSLVLTHMKAYQAGLEHAKENT